jgi:metallo-beta-lactamase family protein
MQNYLKALLPDKRTDVLFVGYQAKGTPGRDIQRYAPNISGKPTGYVMLEG